MILVYSLSLCMVVEAGQVEHREEGEEGESKSVGMSDSYSTEGMPYCFTDIQYPVTCMCILMSTLMSTGGDDQLSTDNNSDSDKSEPVHKKSNNSSMTILYWGRETA